MGKLKKLLKILGILVLLLALAAGGFYFWASRAADARLAQKFKTHSVEFPVPFPLSAEEVAALRKERAAAATPATEGKAEPDADAKKDDKSDDENKDKPADAKPADPLAGVDLAALAMKRAIARGKHLVQARYACVECHGKDFGGGTMMDAMPVARLFGPNLTTGKGSKTRDYKIADWDRRRAP